MTKVGTCPVCSGTKIQEYKGSHASILAGFDPENHTIPCQNCGGQYQFGLPVGMVRYNIDDEPCTHEYHLSELKCCLRTYTCTHCNDTHQIDSGD